MKKIETLLAQLKQELPNVIKSRIEKLKGVLTDLSAAQQKLATENTEENQEEVDELNDKAIAMEESIVERLEALLEVEAKTPTQAPASPETPPASIENPETKEPKKKKGGWFVVTAIAVAVITLGAVTLSNKSK
jgi:hypothetical protein